MASAARRLTPEEYLAIERKAEYKSEYVNGCLVAMSGASRKHNLITWNLSRVIGNQLAERGCEAYSSDMRVKVDAAGQYRYPDIVVVCGEPQFEDDEVDTLLNPTLIVGVLSPSTEAFDRGDKFAAYRRLPALRAYIMVSQDTVRVEHYAREGEHWVLTEYTSLDEPVPLPAIDCTLNLRDVYRKVALGPDPTRSTSANGLS